MPALENAYSAFEINNFSKSIYLAEHSQNPRIRVLDFNFEEVKAITDVCQFEVLQLIADHHKDLLYVVCGAPEFEIKVVDLASSSTLSFRDLHRIPVTENFISFTLHSAKGRLAILLEKEQLVFYSIKQTFQNKAEGCEKCLGLELFSLAIDTVIKSREEEEQFVSLHWDVSGVVHIATTRNRLVSLCSQTLQVLDELHFENVVSFVGRVDNELYVLNDSKFSHQRFETVRTGREESGGGQEQVQGLPLRDSQNRSRRSRLRNEALRVGS